MFPDGSEYIFFSSKDYTGGASPWDLPGFTRGDDGTEDDHAYGRRDTGNWKDNHFLVCDEVGVLKKMPINDSFRDMPTRSGAVLRGPIFMYRELIEDGCGDSVRMAVETSFLANKKLEVEVPIVEL